MADLSKAANQAAAHAARLVLYARQWIDASAAQDCVQQALVSLLSLRRPPDDPLAWMYTAVRNAAIDLGRSEQRRRRREQATASARPWFSEASHSPLDAETAKLALEKVPAELREAVILRVWGELGFAQIAAIAGVSVGTAHGRVSEGLEKLRALLGDRKDVDHARR